MALRRPGASAERGGTRTVQVLIVEDGDLFRSALVSLLSKEEDIEVVADLTCDPEAVVDTVASLRPSVVVVAADTGDDDGLRTVLELREHLPGCGIVALTVGWPAALVRRLLAADVTGMVDKNTSATQLLRAIRVVADGGTHFGAGLAAVATTADANPFTKRELHVLQAVADGASGPEIASRLSLSPRTVRNYLSNAMSKAGARTRIDVVRIAAEAGWL
jgi:two-component system, NarL family, response regulator DesR